MRQAHQRAYYPLFFTWLFIFVPFLGKANESLDSAHFSVDRFSRNAVIAFWHRYYLPDQRSYVETYGQEVDFESGIIPTPSRQFNSQVQRRVNFYRAMVGLPTDIDFSTSLVTRRASDTFNPPAGTTKEQACREMAYWMARNRIATHTPSGGSNWPVTEAARNGAANSNLAFGSYGPAAVDEYMFEPGTLNDPLFNRKVGHRRALLYSRAQKMATGDVPPVEIVENGQTIFSAPTNAIYTIGNFKEEQEAQFVAWPNDGFVPVDLIPTFWSLSYPGAIFENATVRMTGPNGRNVPVIIRGTTLGFSVNPDELQEVLETTGASTGSARSLGESTISWEPQGIATEEDVATIDAKYTVTVSGIQGNGPSSYTYETTLINPFRLEQDLTLQGVPNPPLEGAGYAFEPVPEVDEYRFEITIPKAADWFLDAENEQPELFELSPVTINQLPDTDWRSNWRSAGMSGSRSYALSFPNRFDGFAFNEQSIIISRRFTPNSDATLEFDYYQGFMASDSTVTVEVTRDGGVTFETLWSLQGNSNRVVNPEDPFTPLSLPLNKYVGEVLGLRFRISRPNNAAHFFYRFENGGQPVPNIGFFFDNVRVTNSLSPSQRIERSLPSSSLKAEFSKTVVGGDLLPGQVYDLRARAVIGGAALAWGQPLQVVPTPGTLSGWQAYTTYDEPSVRSFESDDDGDGMSNGIEYVLGTSALDPADSAPVSQSDIFDDRLELSVPIGDGELSDVVFEAEYSMNGRDWFSDGTAVEVEQGMLTAMAPRQGRERMFLRWTARLK